MAEISSPTPTRAVEPQELQAIVEAMQLPTDARPTSAWLKRPDKWSTFVLHVPPKYSKSREALAIKMLAANLVDSI